MRVAFYTLGCKLNQSESEALASSFKSRGFFVGRHDEDADIFIVNTCTVTSKAEQKARRIIRHLARGNPEALIIITGCYAQLDAPFLQTLAPNVLVFGHDRKYQLLELAECIEKTGVPDNDLQLQNSARDCISGFLDRPADTHGIFRFDADTYSFHSRAFLKIQDGCDHQCAYCRVRLARGKSVSLSPDEVIARAEHLAASGYREIVLTGVNITAYQAPGDSHFRLPRLLEYITSRPGTFRVRLSSLEPEMITREFISAAAHPRICPHFHIPVQSGSDRILKAVYRPYTADKLRSAVRELRRIKEDPFLAADVIVGLPGETDEDFEATRSLIEELEFAALHVFPFSPRPGTELYHSKHHVPERIAGERSSVLRDMADRLHEVYASRWIGRELEILPEEPKIINGEKFWSGWSENYLRVEFSLKGLDLRSGVRPVEKAGLAGTDLSAADQGVRGSLVRVLLTGMEDDRLVGTIRQTEL